MNFGVTTFHSHWHSRQHATAPVLYSATVIAGCVGDCRIGYRDHAKQCGDEIEKTYTKREKKKSINGEKSNLCKIEVEKKEREQKQRKEFVQIVIDGDRENNWFVIKFENTTNRMTELCVVTKTALSVARGWEWKKNSTSKESKKRHQRPTRSLWSSSSHSHTLNMPRISPPHHHVF